MADECDVADAYTEKFLYKRIAEESKQPIPGAAGVCSICGHPSPRIVETKCVGCRNDEELAKKKRGF